MFENSKISYFNDANINFNHNDDDGYEMKTSLQHRCDECHIVFNKEISLMVI